ncbi:MAG: glycoside hydrolase family 5 protein [Treponema sp.]|nr:glycoside hydrolase family 5 protein [Treponema sp.]
MKFILAFIAGILMISCISNNTNGKYYLSAEAPPNPQPFNDISAAQLVSDIRTGWNLGNALDATDYDEKWIFYDSPLSWIETCWFNPVITKENVAAIKNAGFNAIRIPVSWSKAVDRSKTSSRRNYIIRSDWMDRVTEVINYAVELDLYIIINTHHDEDIFKFKNAQKAESLRAFRIIWEQIAYNFRNYNEKLIFQGLNEPRTKGSAAEWAGGTAEERAVINEYYQVFVDTVRTSGGNNSKRVLMINTYAAASTVSSVNDLLIPKDTTPDKIIVSIHLYSPYTFSYGATIVNGAVRTWDKNNPSDIAPVIEGIDLVYNKFIKAGIPVIIGEYGAEDQNNIDARAGHTEFLVGYAMSKGIRCFWWDGGHAPVRLEGSASFRILNRHTNQFVFPQIVTAIMSVTEDYKSIPSIP